MDWHIYNSEFRQEYIDLGIWTFNQIQPHPGDRIIIAGIRYVVTTREYVARDNMDEGVPLPTLYVRTENNGVIPA